MQYDNAAGRLYQVFSAIAAKKSSHLSVADVANAFRVEPNWGDVLQAYLELRQIYEELVADIESVAHNQAKYGLYRDNLGAIESTLKSFRFSVNENQVIAVIDGAGLVALKFMAADMPQDATCDPAELAKLRAMVEELRQEIENTEGLAVHVKRWLLDLVRLLRDSIDRYAIRGTAIMRRHVAMMVGELVLEYKEIEVLKQQKPGLWAKVSKAIDEVIKVTTLVEKLKPLLGYTQPLADALSLPAPPIS